MASLILKRHAFVSQQIEHEFKLRELVEQFTDEQLREVGLFRDLRDADIARERELIAAEDRERSRRYEDCDGDDCDCPAHHRVKRTGGKPEIPSQMVEREFWRSIHQLATRRDADALMREVENRAWDFGNVFINLTRIITAKA